MALQILALLTSLVVSLELVQFSSLLFKFLVGKLCCLPCSVSLNWKDVVGVAVSLDSLGLLRHFPYLHFYPYLKAVEKLRSLFFGLRNSRDAEDRNSLPRIQCLLPTAYFELIANFYLCKERNLRMALSLTIPYLKEMQQPWRTSCC